MTKLDYPISRETRKKHGKRPIIITIAPAGSQDEALIGLRLKGQRTLYVVALSDVYRLGALWHGQKEAAARRKARKDGIPWRIARRQFILANSIPPVPRKRKTSSKVDTQVDTSKTGVDTLPHATAADRQRGEN